ncbi:TetR/AcrR family transcriptional regulator [uncultured Maricaulis sp.]|jgi:AcrR family transcriptional regulator|uniref:TetR/AcrR family transcriptional regulator n=1 Tax=uncultured Maricaulis sp. TaxID=174710 RepID=UPI0025FA235B|nr:TetR/AcrR family transcriptional regulator [uncultured Maricaulis sp.]
MTGMLREDLFEGSNPNIGVTAKTGTTKARIERAALQLFASHGMDGVSIKQIAEACTISDGAMYRHFKSKDALARLMFEAIHKKLLDMVASHLTPDASLEDISRALVTAYCNLADEDPAQFTYHLTHRNYFIAASGDGGADPSDLMTECIAQAMERGEIPKGDPELRSAMALGVVMQAAEYSLYGRIERPLSQHIDQFTRGIMAVLRS